MLISFECDNNTTWTSFFEDPKFAFTNSAKDFQQFDFRQPIAQPKGAATDVAWVTHPEPTGNGDGCRGLLLCFKRGYCCNLPVARVARDFYIVLLRAG